MSIHPRFTRLLVAALLVAAGCTASPETQTPDAAAPASPYAGQQARVIKALSAEDIDAYRTAQGMGLAKAAELNHYPGPRHVLALADSLGLTPDQRAQTQRIFEAMEAAARPLGERIIDREGALDALFAGGHADAPQVQALLGEIAALQADLRFAHLNAHLAMRALLTEAQVQRYDLLRGYADGAAHEGHDPAMRHHQ